MYQRRLSATETSEGSKSKPAWLKQPMNHLALEHRAATEEPLPVENLQLKDSCLPFLNVKKLSFYLSKIIFFIYQTIEIQKKIMRLCLSNLSNHVKHFLRIQTCCQIV